MQIKAKEANTKLNKVQDQYEAGEINRDVRTYEEQEKRKKDQMGEQMKAHKASLEKQIVSKNSNPVMAEHEYMINKKIIDNIEGKLQGSPGGTSIKKPF